MLLLLYLLHAKHVQVDITMLLQDRCKLSNACSVSAQSLEDSSQVGKPASISSSMF